MRLTSLSLSLFISSPSFSLWLQDTCHLMPFTKYSLLDQSYFFTSCLSIAHIKFTNKIHQLFTDYLLRLPYSELLETHLFRSRANRRLVFSRSLWPQVRHLYAESFWDQGLFRTSCMSPTKNWKWSICFSEILHLSILSDTLTTLFHKMWSANIQRKTEALLLLTTSDYIFAR